MKKLSLFALLAIATSATADNTPAPAAAAKAVDQQVAWQKKTPDDIRVYDETAFQKELAPYSQRYWRDFSPDQKKRAMDLADKNKMTPDAAVEKVHMESKR